MIRERSMQENNSLSTLQQPPLLPQWLFPRTGKGLTPHVKLLKRLLRIGEPRSRDESEAWLGLAQQKSVSGASGEGMGIAENMSPQSAGTQLYQSLP